MPADKPRSNWTDLSSRIASGVLMALAALAAAWFGGLVFFLFWLCAGLAIFAEWLAMVTGTWRPTLALAAGGAMLAAAGILAFTGLAAWSLAAVLAGTLGVIVGLGKQPRALLAGLGVPYAAASFLPAVLLRADPLDGASAIFFLFAVVWGTDIMAYFCGRTLGGPKLWPAISPKKTWSGFLGGTFFGAAAGAGVAYVAGIQGIGLVFVLAMLLAVVSQGGDLLESALKRHFGVKDASHLIPGHGGVMDRLDGFIAAGLLAVLIGLAHDPALPAFGLLQWR